MKSNSKDGVINFYCCCIHFLFRSLPPPKKKDTQNTIPYKYTREIWLKALGVRSLNYYAPFCNMFNFFFVVVASYIFAPSG